MLQLVVRLSPEGWDEEKQLEHSLVSLSKWESKWCKSFMNTMSQKLFTTEEILDYIRCMTITQRVDPEVYFHLSEDNLRDVIAYINAPMTATTFRDDPNAKKNREIITAELIYHWMIETQVPFECRKWHLNQLLTLIRVRNVKLQPPKKMSRSEIMARNASLNAARRKQLGTRG